MANQIASNEVVGRDALIAILWRKLLTESFRFTAERRVGKTSVMQKMAEEQMSGMEVIYLDLEKVDSVNHFVECLLDMLKPLLCKTQKMRAVWDKNIKSLGGLEIADVIKLPKSSRDHWQKNLEKTLGWACEQTSGSKIVLFFDELPYMLQKIAISNDKGNHQALHLIDTLRAIRKTHDANLRMVFAGSVGLHHVLKTLRGGKLSSEPVNNMDLVEIKPLEPVYAIKLATDLIGKEQINCREEIEIIAETIATQCDCVPFYIERVASRLADAYQDVSSKDVIEVVQKCLTDDSDSWEMEHFRSRLEIYYPLENQDTQENRLYDHAIASAVLDTLACANLPLSINQVCAEIKATMAFDNKKKIIELLKSLAQDHYLSCNTNKQYAFRFNLIKRWWLLAQGLENNNG